MALIGSIGSADQRPPAAHRWFPGRTRVPHAIRLNHSLIAEDRLLRSTNQKNAKVGALTHTIDAALRDGT